MEALSVEEYRNNLAVFFIKVDNGEQVLVRRKNEIYALVKVDCEDLMITLELQARIDKAREEIKPGKCVTFKSSEDIDACLNSLWCTQLGLPTGWIRQLLNGRNQTLVCLRSIRKSIKNC